MSLASSAQHKRIASSILGTVKPLTPPVAAPTAAPPIEMALATAFMVTF